MVSWDLGHLDLLPPDVESGAERCRLYLSVPRPLQTVQRADLWEVIICALSLETGTSGGGQLERG